MTTVAYLLFAALAEPQGWIRGRIVLAETGEPIAGVTVDLSGRIHGDRYEQSVRSGADGDFRFERLAAGSYDLATRKTGYLPMMGFPFPVTLETNVTLRFHRYGVLSGSVTGPDGEPVAGAEVVAYRYRWVDGRRSRQRVEATSADDRGQYRLFGLPAGNYLLAAIAPRQDWPEGELEQTAMVYYPSSTQLRWGQELSDLDLVLRPQPAYSITGALADSQAGGACRTCTIRIERMEQGVEMGVWMRYGTRADGTYRIQGLPPGTYRVLAEKGDGAGGHLAAARTVTLGNRNLGDVHLVVGLNRTLRGRLVLESPPEGLDLSKTTPVVALVDGVRTAARARVDSQLAFQTAGLAPLVYRLRPDGLPAGGYFKLLRWGGQDLPAPEIEVPEEGTLGPVEAVIGFDGATLSGTVQPSESAGRGHRVTSATVALYPQENQSPYLVERRVPADANGKFTLTGVAPGSYTAFALPAGSALDWGDPDVRRQFARYGRSVDLGRAKQVTVELSLAPESDATAQ